MIDERMFNLLRDQLSVAQAEKSSLYAQVASLTQEVHMLRDSMKEHDFGLKETIVKLQEIITESNKKIDILTSSLKEKETIITNLLKKIEDLNSRNSHNRAKRFARTSEQAALLNNRNVDERASEKDGFDGKQVDDISSTRNNTVSDKNEKRKRIRPTSGESEKQFVNETITHKLEDYHKLPDGAHYITRNGKTDIALYEYIEYLPARVVKHVYEVARVAMADGRTIESSLPENLKMAAVEGCPFTAGMLAFIYCEKYAYHSSINTVKKKLRDLGAVFSKSALNRYYHKGIDALVACLADTLHEETRKSDYLMIDETCELVAELDRDTGKIRYKKKYLWAFFDKVRNIISYIYEKGSRARKVVLDFLKGFCGCISTDGYVVYKIFDDAEKHPDITHVGCWAHARRYFVDALECDRKNCMDVIETIAELFDIEYTCKIAKMNFTERKIERQSNSVPVLTRLYGMVHTMSKDVVLMANTLMAKAVNYLLNQWQNLFNYIMDGRVEISNNMVEQRMKTIKLAMKNCQNIGSEKAAEGHAFMHSLFEGCSLNKIRPMEYFTNLYSIYKTLDDVGKVNILPCYYHNMS